MNREETKNAIKVMQHWVDGGEITISEKEDPDKNYDDCVPSWNFYVYTYGIKKLSGECWVTINVNGNPESWKEKPSGEYHPLRIRWEEID